MPQFADYIFSDERSRDRFGLLVCVAFGVLFALFSGVNAERLPVKTYTVADGLQRDSVLRIRMDSRGFLWFCTSEGISRFDGAGMTNFTVADGLPDRFVEDFLETSSGEIYIATGKGLARLNPHGLRGSKENPLFTVFLPDNRRAEKIQTLFEDRNRQIWVGTSDGLYKLSKSSAAAGDFDIKLEAVSLSSPLDETISVNEIIEDRRGALWIATADNGLLKFSSNNETKRWTTADGFAENKVETLLETSDGEIWAGFRNGGGLCRLDGEANVVKKCYTAKDGLPTTWITDLLQTSDSKIWLATVAGLCSWQGEGGASVCKTYNEQNDLCAGIAALAEDKDGNLWTGSTCGAKKIARYGFTAYYESDGLDWAKTNSIFENAAGDLFVSTAKKSRFVSRFDGEKFSRLKPPVPENINYHGWGWQQTVFQDSRGAWWIPTGSGLFRSPDDTNFENLERAALEKVEFGAKDREIFRLFEDSRGDVWATVTFNELWRWERAANHWHNHTGEIKLSPNRLISAFAEAPNGDIWIGTGTDDAKEYYESALVRYRNGSFRVFNKSEGAPSGWTRDLFFDSRERLWIASTQDGLMRLDETASDTLNFTRYTPENGLTSIATACVTEDEFGRIYVGTWRGIDRLTLDTGQIENFTTADGLPASFVESAYRDRRNNLWFATENGLARFQPEPLRKRTPPNILISGLRVGGESQAISILGETGIPMLDLASDKRQVSIDFQGLGASLGEKLNYEYRFGDADWTATGERTLNFANLAAGEYKFEVRAQTADRIYSQPATVSFKIAAPIWQRPWFLLLAGVLIGFIIYLIYKARLKRLLELEKVRTRIATDLHDDIGANLTRISLLSEVAKQKSTNGNGQMLASIADIARESVASMNDIVWAIAPEHDSLSDLTRRMRSFAEEVFATRDVDLEFNATDADLKLSVGVRRDILLIFKEAVNNAAKHSDCTKVRIDFTCQNSVLRLSIKDDGKGFDSSETFDGQGLRSITRRADALGGDLKIESANGTTVEFEMNLQNASAG